MLEINSNGKIEINPNEEIRRQFLEIIGENDEISEEIFDEINDILLVLKQQNYFQYCVTIKLIYKDVYTYLNYINKMNETSKIDKYNMYLINSFNYNEILQKCEENIDLLIENFTYILTLNNMLKVKMLLELSKLQNEYLFKITPFHLYDLQALQDYMGFRVIEDYYLENFENDSSEEDDEIEKEDIDDEDEIIFKMVPEEIVDDIINFLNYLHNNHKEIYIKTIKEIIEKIYKWCYYYIENSIEVEDTDLEIRVINLVNGCSIEEISEKLNNNEKLLSEILLRVFDDIDMGYPSITTIDGDKLVTESELNDHIIKVKRKQK